MKVVFAVRSPAVETTFAATGQPTLSQTKREKASPFTGLVARLFAGPEPAKVVAFVSCKAQEGVTRTVRSLDAFLASKMNTPSKVVTAEDCIFDVPGGRESGPSVTADRTHAAPIVERLAALRQEYDAILIDGGSIDTSPVVLQLASHIDGFVLVVAAGQRGKQDIRRAVEIIEAAQGRVVGVVLNKRQYPIPGWLYPFFHRTLR